MLPLLFSSDDAASMIFQTELQIWTRSTLHELTVILARRVNPETLNKY